MSLSAAAPMVPHASDPAGDELVRAARARAQRQRLDRVRRRIYSLEGLAVIVGAAATAATIEAGPAFSPWTTLTFVLVLALLSGIRFEAGSVIAVPTQLVFVPMLFALPLGEAPAVVVAGFVVGRGWRAFERRDVAQLLPQLTNAVHAFGPVLVLALMHGLPLRWSAWPIYLVALAAQFAFDFANSVVGELGDETDLRTIVGFTSTGYAVDAALAPIGLLAAFAIRSHPALVVLVLPLALLLRHFSQERKQRIDHALELSDAYRGTAFLLGDVIEADDVYTGSHSRHVVDLVLGVCDRLGLDAAGRRDAEFVALLHDVGKIRIPGEIINKPEPLDPEERALIETHTIEGELLLDQVGGLLGHVGRLVRSCHEHWDGRGYPDRLAGEQIPLVARIVCACDAYSAMTTDRPYRAARTVADAIAELHRCAGTQFDPSVVTALAAAIEELPAAVVAPVAVGAAR